MKTIISFLILILFPLLIFSQDNKDTQKNPKDINFTVTKQQEPFYPKGDKDLFLYIWKNIKYSDSAIAKKVDGNVMISFDVLPDSSLSGIVVLSGVGYGIDEQVAGLFAPLKYAPGIMNGTNVKMNSVLTIPVRAH